MDTLQLFLSRMGDYKLLNQEEEIELSKRIEQGDQEAINILVEHNIRLVVSIAKSYTDENNSLLDLIQEGCIALRTAAIKYNYRYNTRFSTYATFWIQQRLDRVKGKNELIRIPNYVHEKRNTIFKKKIEYMNQYGYEPSDEELSKYCKIDLNTIIKMSKYNHSYVSFEHPVNEDQKVEDFLGNSDNYEYLKQEELHQELLKVFIDAGLKPREKEIICMRYGINYDHEYTLEEIASCYGLTKERIRQIQKVAEAKIKKEPKAKRLLN